MRFIDFASFKLMADLIVVLYFVLLHFHYLYSYTWDFLSIWCPTFLFQIWVVLLDQDLMMGLISQGLIYGSFMTGNLISSLIIDDLDQRDLCT